MLFPTFTFAVFFAVVFTLNWRLNHSRRAWMVVMLVASYVFYGYWNWRYVGLIVLSTTINQVLAVRCHRAPSPEVSQWWARGAVVANLALLGWFKYYGFFVTDVVDLLGPLAPDLPLIQVVLPVGISFFTFQAMSYVLDVHRGKIEPATPIEFAVYLAFFPQLVAGPIVRATEFLPQLRERRDPRNIDLTRALALVGAGLFKKVVVSSYLATALVDDAFASPSEFSSLELLSAVYGYSIQIYADFSGYTDIAIGVALLMGFRFPINFDRPYGARSLQEFWRRWHMTLSRWLRDYLYIPLGGNRGGERRRDRNLLLTMLLGGLWHGAAWTFVVWGGIHGGWLIIERKIRSRRAADAAQPAVARRPATDERPPLDAPATTSVQTVVRRTVTSSTVRAWGRSPFVEWLVTFHIVALAWVFFRADSLSTAFGILGRIFTAWGGVDAVSPVFAALVGASLLAQFVSREFTATVQWRASALPPIVLCAAFGVWLFIIDVFGPEGVAPFIYFQF